MLPARHMAGWKTKNNSSTIRLFNFHSICHLLENETHGVTFTATQHLQLHGPRCTSRLYGWIFFQPVFSVEVYSINLFLCDWGRQHTQQRCAFHLSQHDIKAPDDFELQSVCGTQVTYCTKWHLVRNIFARGLKITWPLPDPLWPNFAFVFVSAPGGQSACQIWSF